MKYNSGMNLLLQLAKNNDSIEFLQHKGLYFSQLTELLDICIFSELLVIVDDKLLITQSGINYLKMNQSKHYSKKSTWVSPLDKYLQVWDNASKYYIPSREIMQTWIDWQKYPSQ